MRGDLHPSQWVWAGVEPGSETETESLGLGLVFVLHLHLCHFLDLTMLDLVLAMARRDPSCARAN